MDSNAEESPKAPAKPTPDMDTQMIAGCTGFVSASVFTYILAVWPHLLWSDTHRMPTLWTGLAVGCLPAIAVGVFCTRKYGLAGGAGFFAGAAVTAVFLFLRLQQVMAFIGIEHAPQPEYPYSWMWIVPFGWLLIAALLVLVFLPRGEFAEDP